ncbi:MAG: nuclear transport factor 2 family protein [Sphingomonadaceae bacterium]|nr:nuclear transport factor 2 family protein [Sphingomonadaceae bacterium]
MKILLAAAAAASLCTAGFGTAAAQHHRAGSRGAAAAIRALEERWNQDWAHRDVARLAAHYTNDAVLMAPGSRMVGMAQIRAGIAEMVADPALALHFHAERVEVSAAGDLAYTQGTYTMRMTDPRSHRPFDDHGSYVTTYRRQADGSWKAVDDIASSAVTPG